MKIPNFLSGSNMIVHDNIWLKGVSGKVKDLVVKRYGDKTIITTVPNMANRVLSEKQIFYQKQMKRAIRHAKAITANPARKEIALRLLQVPANKLFRKIV